MMGFVPLMWLVWGVIVLILVALKLYSDVLTRDEADQVVLDSAFDHVKAQQASIIARVHKIEPAKRVALWTAVAATVFVMGYYVMDIFNQFK